MNLKKAFIFLLIINVLSCTTQDNQTALATITTLHQKATQSKYQDSIAIYLKQARNIIHKNKQINSTIKAENSFLTANYYYAINNLDSAYTFYNSAIHYLGAEFNSDKEKEYFISLAYIYKKNGDYLNSLSILEKLEKRINNKKDYVTLAEINNQKQSIYKLLKNYKKTLEYNKKSVKYFALAQDTSKLVNSLIIQSSLNYYNFKNKKETYRLLDSILTINLNGNKHKNILTNQIYQNYGIFKYYDGDYQASFNNYYKAITFLKKPINSADSLGLANTYANIAEVCLDLKKYKLSKKYLDSVDLYSNILETNLRDFNLQNKLRLSYETNAGFSSVSNNLAHLTHSMNKNYETRINNELTALKEANQKEKELLITNQKVTLHNAELKRKQIILFSVLGFLLLSTFIGIQYYRQKKLKFEKEEIFMQQRLFRAQMNPHFTSNILSNIQELNLIDSKKANRYLIKFSRLLRLNLENSMQNFTLLEKEIEVLSKYLDLQQLRYPDRFEYEINTNDLEIDLISIPPMLIQPFVENAIKHGFKEINYKGKITINLIEKENFIYCQIIDNGVGLQVSNDEKDHRSASTLLIKKLLKNMINQEVAIKNNVSGKGTIVAFNIPFKD